MCTDVASLELKTLQAYRFEST